MTLLFDKIPRARLYVRNKSLAKALARLPRARIMRGKAVEVAERELASYFGVTAAHTVSSCRVGYYLVLKALGLKSGDEVLMTPLTIPDMVNAVHALGLRPVFVDMSYEAQNIDVADIERKATPRSRVLLVTHLSGFAPDMDAIREAAGARGLTLIEDVSQAQAASFRGRPLGSFGLAAVLTTSISKTISTLWGGAVLSSDAALIDRVRRASDNELRAPSKRFLARQILANLKVNVATQRHVFSWMTYYGIRALAALKPAAVSELHDRSRERRRFTDNPRILRDEMPRDAMTFFCDLQAEVLLESLHNNDRATARRVVLAERLLSRLAPAALACFPPRVGKPHVDTFWHFPIVVPGGPARRLAFQKALLASYIDTTGYGLALCSKESAFSRYAAETPVAEEVKNGTVFLPMHDSFTETQIDAIAGAVNRFFEREPGVA